MAPLLAVLAISVVADNVDLPVATQGTEQWSGVLAKAMTMGGRDQDASLQSPSVLPGQGVCKECENGELKLLHST